jgi:hypothetical protein
MNTNKNVMSTHANNAMQSGLLSTAQTTAPVESLKRKTRGRIPERKIGMQPIESQA